MQGINQPKATRTCSPSEQDTARKNPTSERARTFIPRHKPFALLDNPVGLALRGRAPHIFEGRMKARDDLGRRAHRHI